MVLATRRSIVNGALSGAVVMACGALTPTPVFAVQFARALDMYQGFNPKKDKQTPVGYITSLKIGGVTFQADLTAMDFTTWKTFPAVAVMTNYQWQTGATDAMYIAAQLSNAGKTNISTMLLSGLRDLRVEFGYVIYEFDPVMKKYFISNSSQQSTSLFVLNGLLEKQGDQVNLAVDNDPSYAVQSPKNFAFQIAIKPAASPQGIPLGIGFGKNVVRPWGVNQR